MSLVNKKQAVWLSGSTDMVCPPPTSNPDLWQFDLETGMRVTSKVGSLTFLPSEGTLGLWVLELFAMYAMDS